MGPVVESIMTYCDYFTLTYILWYTCAYENERNKNYIFRVTENIQIIIIRSYRLRYIKSLLYERTQGCSLQDMIVSFILMTNVNDR